MYIKDPASGKWTAVPGMESLYSSVFDAIDPNHIDELIKEISIDNFKSLGTDSLNGKPMRVYQYTTTTTQAGITSTGTTKIWIGVSDGLPYKSEADGEVVGQAGSKSHTVTTYEYDPSITIEPPV